MKTIIENDIKNGRYELKDMLTKIDTAGYQGQIDSVERDELMRMARNNATASMGYAGIEERMARLEERVTQLENSIATPVEDEYPAWVQPTGAHDAYMSDAKITYNGAKYICVAPADIAVTYPPDVLPGMWLKVVS